MSWVYIPDEAESLEDVQRPRTAANDDWRTRDPVTVIVTTPVPVLIGGALFIIMCFGGLGFLIGYWAH